MQNGKDLYNRKHVPDWQRCNIDDIKLPTLKNFIKKYPQFVLMDN